MIAEVIALNPQDTQKFAENVCFDYNPVHKVGNNPQYLPGDWLFLTYLQHIGLPKSKSLIFKGAAGVLPEEKIVLDKNEIKAQNSQIKFQDIDSIAVRGGYYLPKIQDEKKDNSDSLKYFFPSFDHKTLEFAKQYCLISGDLVGSKSLSGGVLEQILNTENLQRTQSSVFIYRGSSFITSQRLDEIKSEENIGRDLIHVETSIAKGILKIGVRYRLFNENTNYTVADLKKEVVCYNLQPK